VTPRLAFEIMAGRTLPDDEPRGSDLGLPAEGPGSVASVGARVLAFLVDAAVGALMGGLVNAVVADPTAVQRSVAVNGAFALQLVVLQGLTGQSIGMRLMGLRVWRLKEASGLPGLLPAAIRTALLLLLVPALISDRDGRGLHDKAAGTVVVRAR
jgi:uncharacterized RDD family membrane protein YckC